MHIGNHGVVGFFGWSHLREPEGGEQCDRVHPVDVLLAVRVEEHVHVLVGAACIDAGAADGDVDAVRGKFRFEFGPEGDDLCGGVFHGVGSRRLMVQPWAVASGVRMSVTSDGVGSMDTAWVCP